jgi:tetratricopeptide (TPR) repeat protein
MQNISNTQQLMNAEEALDFLEKLKLEKTGKYFEKLEIIILQELWQNQITYLDIAKKHVYTENYVKEVGAGLWKKLSELLDKKVNKGTFKLIVERYWEAQQNLVAREIQTSSVNLNFVGREQQIAELNQLVLQGAKIIVIQGKGGVGKSTLAHNYFKINNFDVLQLRLGKEIQNISSVESVVEEWLQREFHEEPARDFNINLERLRRKLQEKDRRIGISINSLETALDSSGQLIQSRRHYIQLLEILADPYVNSVTLITTRESLYEPTVEVRRYRLKGLDEDAWRQFFQKRGIHVNRESPVIGEMCQAYGGNAKAMQILSGAILADFHGDIDTYWHVTKKSGDLLLERELKDLVTSQFHRLRKNNLAAYKLLCRLGCYRYKDIPSVPIEALLCLLWDVPDLARFRVIQDLQDLSLIEFHKGKYWLHSVIMLEAKQRLNSTNEWKLVNQRAAEYWTQSTHTIVDANDALTALEAYYHYVKIEDYEQASDVISRKRSNQWNRGLPLGCSLYQLGLLQKVIDVITPILHKIKNAHRLIGLYQIIGYTYRIFGNLDLALECCNNSIEIVDKTLIDEEYQKICILFNIGLCKMDLWEIAAAKSLFEQVCQLSLVTTSYNNYIVYSQSCLAFLHSYSNSPAEALFMADKTIDILTSSTITASWGTGHNLVNIAVAYKNLNHLDKSWEICKTAILNSENNKFTQVHARAITCMAEIERERMKFNSAISLHKVAIEMLSKIGAKSDLAEAYYQLGLTFSKMGNVDKSQNNFETAIKLFDQTQAPKQVQKVKSAIIQ